MFNAFSSMWNQSGVVASVDGVIREVGKGNAVEVQKLYFKLKKDSYKHSLEKGITPYEAEQSALETVEPEKLRAYRNIVQKLTAKGGILAEIDDWLLYNDPR